MPSKTKRQATAMRIAAAGKGNLGIPQAVAQDFAAADAARGSSFGGQFGASRVAKPVKKPAAKASFAKTPGKKRLFQTRFLKKGK
jgi:hypothetical protein